MSGWHFRALVPNVRLQEAIGSHAIAMVPYGDERLRKMSDTDDRLRKLLEGFSDQFGRKRHPSAIISARTSAPLPGADLIDFRNVIALSCLVGGAQHTVLSQSPVSSVIPIVCCDYFDLYPMYLPGNGHEALLSSSYGGIGMDTDIRKFRGQTSPALHNVDAAVPIPDRFVLDTLMNEWTALYVDGRPAESRVLRVFRSLQVAYHAAAMPAKNGASLHDFGIAVSQWVSSMEVLLHPDKNKVDQVHVLKSLAKHRWIDPELTKQHWSLPGSGSRAEIPLNLVQHLCHQLYRTRHDFVHGNDLSNTPYHSPLENMQGPGWLLVAPLAFRAALSCCFDRYDPGGEFENALLAVLRDSSYSP